ncbi:Nod factor export ATP-binding protein I [Geodia barretti]|uniref:Nod factor export ATP-binding protein I n=1 Tax=Geodia barretti TaxID=519541 RepID=A0AA35XHM0_GEOBA|nr:Nod factor export ATP-binding protein I [Geodia barretti]
MSAAIRVEGLVKRYGSFTAVNDISFDVKEGEIFGILGPNGAGKTTTLEIIEGLQKPTAGNVNVLGGDVLREANRIKSRIGIQLQASAYFNYLSLLEILRLLASFYPKSANANELLNVVGLEDKGKSRIDQLSIGQRQRFTVAASLINDPELVILDEPTTGLDPQARHNLWDLIRDINHRKVTVVLTTHYMEEAESLCQRLAIMDQGRIIAIDSPSNLISQIETTYTIKLVTSNPLTVKQQSTLQKGATFQEVEIDPDSQPLAGNPYVLRLDKTSEALNDTLDGIVSSGISLKHLEILPATLEDVFLELTGNELRE